MDGQPTRPLVYAGSYTACCEGGGRPLRGLSTPFNPYFRGCEEQLCLSNIDFLFYTHRTQIYSTNKEEEYSIEQVFCISSAIACFM